MFTKVLVAEDMDHISGGVERMLKEMGVREVAFAQYCDDALLLLRKAQMEGSPFPLLITDLSFKPSHRDEKLKDGAELALAAKAGDAHLRCIIYSMEDRPGTVKQLVERTQAEGYVCKDRNGLRDLQEAVHRVHNGQPYFSPQIESVQNPLSLTALDICILKLLADGKNQGDISIHIQKNKLGGHSRSYIEKRIQNMREVLGAKSTLQMVLFARDLRII
ncbi:helix-turn-helix domain-containing protein [Aequorivita echinoideorum]|uniref:DNA-binding response regulator n=1 Tax=Aequorivita echinoideorum TaxID=1549647 RepID=A0ABS5S3V4_9FLAO|nr:DNA-binding response regulator [Aequorivita echinoideorum]MBT0607891.1 DNA-binding response regulator [Aequorivita echinoideorum]